MSVLLYVEHSEGKFKKSTFELVSYASEIAVRNQTTLTAISIGNVENEELFTLGKYGVDKILNVNSSNLRNFNNQAFASVIAEVVNKLGSDLIILSSTFSGRGLAPRIAAKLRAGLADNVVSLPNQADGKFIIKNMAFSGKAIANVEIKSTIKVISLSANSYKVVENNKPIEIEEFLSLKPCCIS